MRAPGLDGDRASELAREHALLVDELGRLGALVQSLAVRAGAPWPACCVGDLALVLPEVVVRARPAGREDELAALLEALPRDRPHVSFAEPEVLDASDLLVDGEVIYCGWSTSTNHAGLRRLAHLVLEHGYRVKAVELSGAARLCEVATRVAPGLLLVDPTRAALSRIRELELLSVHPTEPAAAGALLAGDTVLLPPGSERTAELLMARNVPVASLAISHLARATGALSRLVLSL